MGPFPSPPMGDRAVAGAIHDLPQHRGEIETRADAQQRPGQRWAVLLRRLALAGQRFRILVTGYSFLSVVRMSSICPFSIAQGSDQISYTT